MAWGGSHETRALAQVSDEPSRFRWVAKANVFIGSIVAVAILTMALAALYSGGGSNQIELSSVSRVPSSSH